MNKWLEKHKCRCFRAKHEGSVNGLKKNNSLWLFKFTRCQPTWPMGVFKPMCSAALSTTVIKTQYLFEKCCSSLQQLRKKQWSCFVVSWLLLALFKHSMLVLFYFSPICIINSLKLTFLQCQFHSSRTARHQRPAHSHTVDLPGHRSRYDSDVDCSESPWKSSHTEAHG